MVCCISVPAGMGGQGCVQQCEDVLAGGVIRHASATRKLTQQKMDLIRIKPQALPAAAVQLVCILWMGAWTTDVRWPVSFSSGSSSALKTQLLHVIYET